MENFMTKAEVIELLESAGVKIPLEKKFDLTGVEKPEIVMEFIRLTDGDWRNAIYVSKQGSRYDDPFYFDLLYAIHESGRPVCIPVPIARKVFNDLELREIGHDIPVISGSMYERIYAAYYKRRSEGTKDDLPF
jgi:hypothetical protein